MDEKFDQYQYASFGDIANLLGFEQIDLDIASLLDKYPPDELIRQMLKFVIATSVHLGSSKESFTEYSNELWDVFHSVHEEMDNTYNEHKDLINSSRGVMSGEILPPDAT